MNERLKDAAIIAAETALTIWNEYVFPTVLSVFTIRPLHFAVTRFVSDIHQGDYVLELGSGYPWYKLYSDKVGRDGVFVALDVNHNIQKKSKSISRLVDKVFKRKVSKTDQLTATAAKLPFPDSTFDLVMGSNTPYSFSEVSRVLKSGGRVLLAASELPIPILSIAQGQQFEKLGFRRRIFPGTPSCLLGLHKLYFPWGVFAITNWYMSAKKPG